MKLPINKLAMKFCVSPRLLTFVLYCLFVGGVVCLSTFMMSFKYDKDKFMVVLFSSKVDRFLFGFGVR